MSQAAVRLFVPSVEAPAASSPPPYSAELVTVRQVLEWFERSQLGQDAHPKVLRERRRLWALFVAEFGDVVVGHCKRFQLAGWLDKHAAGLANHTRRRWNATIQVAFNKAKQLDLITANPFDGFKLPKGKKGRDWTDEEYRAILRNTRNAAFRRFIVFIRFSGMRPGEISKTQWGHVKAEGGGWKIVHREHKTDKTTDAARVIPVNAVMLKILAWQRRHNPPGSKNVFLNSKGTPWKTRSLTKNLDSIRQRAGLPKDVKCHGGRHTFITRGLMNGNDLATMAAIAGHKTIATTQGYAHMGDKAEHLLDAMQLAVTPKVRTQPKPKPVKAIQETLPLFECLD